jgi:hypothetical protein
MVGWNRCWEHVQSKEHREGNDKQNRLKKIEREKLHIDLQYGKSSHKDETQENK